MMPAAANGHALEMSLSARSSTYTMGPAQRETERDRVSSISFLKTLQQRPLLNKRMMQAFYGVHVQLITNYLDEH